MADLATPDDLSAFTGQQVDTDRARALIGYASSLVQSYVGKTYGPDDEVPDVVRQVIVAVAARALAAPTGVEFTQETMGPFSKSLRWTPDGGLYLTAAEKQMLDGLRPSRRTAGLGTVSTTRGEELGTLYVPTGPAPSGYPFPWYAADDPLVNRDR